MGIYINNKIILENKEKQKEEQLKHQVVKTMMELQLEKKKNEAFINNLVNTVMQQNIKIKKLENGGI